MRHLFSLLILLAAPYAQAQVLDDYQATVAVDDQGPASRDKGLREALSGVLVHVSGQPAVTSSGRTAPILARASALVRSVGYAKDDKNQLQMTASFEPNAVDMALRQEGLPVHGVLGGAAEDVNLTISGIASTQDYVRALGALRSQPGVKNLNVVSASGDSIVVSLRADGGPARLAGALGVGSVMKRQGEIASAMNYVIKR